MHGQPGRFRPVDESAIRARDHALHFRPGEVPEHARERRAGLTLPQKRRARMRLHTPATCAPQHHRRSAFGERRAGKPPVGVGGAQNPVALLRADDHDLLDVARRQQLRAEVQRRQTDRRVADQRVARAVDPEQRREVTGGRVIDRVGKKRRAGGVRALLHDLVEKLPRVDHPAIRDGEDHGRPRREFRRHHDPRIRQRRQPRRDREIRDRARPPEPRIPPERLDGFHRHREIGKGTARFGIGDRFHLRELPAPDPREDVNEVRPQRRDPAQAGDMRGHTKRALPPPVIPSGAEALRSAVEGPLTPGGGGGGGWWGGNDE